MAAGSRIRKAREKLLGKHIDAAVVHSLDWSAPSRLKTVTSHLSILRAKDDAIDGSCSNGRKWKRVIIQHLRG